MTYKELLDSTIIRDVLEKSKSVIKIDTNDIKELFQQGDEVYTNDIKISALVDKRMELIMSQIKESTNGIHTISGGMVYFFFPEDLPLMMEELKPFSEWIESVPGEFMIKWGMGTHSVQELRAIIILQ